MKKTTGWSRAKRGFSLIECVLAMAIAGLGSAATLSAMSFNQTMNTYEEQRATAHDIVAYRMEQILNSGSAWPFVGNTSDLNGIDSPALDWKFSGRNPVLTVRVTDARTGVVLAPPTTLLKQVEVSLVWSPTGSGSGRTITETLISYLD